MHFLHTRLTRLFAWLVPAMVVAAFLPAATASTANAATTANAYAASAIGVSASSSVANLRSNSIGLASLSCTTTSGLNRKASAAGITLPSLISGGAVNSTVQTATSGTVKTATGSVSIGATSLLGGLISATALGSTTTASVDTSTGAGSATFASNLVGLTIGGQPIAANTAPNTTLTVNLGGLPLAKAVVNQQLVYKAGGLEWGVTRALTVTISNTNTLGLPIGTQVIVGQSFARMTPLPLGAYSVGSGYGLQANLANGVAKTGQIGLAAVPCTGGTSKTTVASGSVASVLTTGTITTATSGTVTPRVNASVTTTVNGTSVLGGLISVSAITASTTYSKTTKASADNSKFVGLKIAGLPLIGDNIAPNTTLSIPGLGSVTFHKVVQTPNGIRVTMLYIVLNNALGVLPTGSVISVGVSQSGTP
ncbi:choice-of-anchor P family protein [Rudaeicoccus suwonensis]|uniref:Uncharacterized protein n=1 Tax=Rudaeicoccus suwonensis TaxID=657409 RepID=A0A561E2V3_9MICO|nr:choice-of-anchor P family protein [Rudaeicoccus suwonensis]TWE09947.1 hypothetical protein BKA23_2292 [Rudaeicoccus suwonensis]